MNRREMFLVGSSTAAAHVLWTTLNGCGAQSTSVGGTTPTTRTGMSLAEEANACALLCENCLTASLNHAANGMTDMLACARLSRECAVLCRAVATLAAAGSSRLSDLARGVRRLLRRVQRAVPLARRARACLRRLLRRVRALCRGLPRGLRPEVRSDLVEPLRVAGLAADHVEVALLDPLGDRPPRAAADGAVVELAHRR
jgi:hypothetical protein